VLTGNTSTNYESTELQWHILTVTKLKKHLALTPPMSVGIKETVLQSTYWKNAKYSPAIGEAEKTTGTRMPSFPSSRIQGQSKHKELFVNIKIYLSQMSIQQLLSVPN